MGENDNPFPHTCGGEEPEIGSGYTTRGLMTELHKVKTDAFREQLTAMIRPAGRGGFSKKQVADMVAGFEDGFRSALLSLREMGVICVDDKK